MNKLYVFGAITIIFLSLIVGSVNVNSIDALTESTYSYILNKGLVTVGDSKSSIFKPLLSFESKNAYFKILFDDVNILSGIDLSKSVLSYDKGLTSYSTSDFELLYYPKDSNNFEFEMIINNPLKSNVINLKIDSYNLEFRKQLSLDESENIDDWDFINSTYAENKDIKLYRPLDIVNSYAVYYIDIPLGESHKVYHIYTNTVTDSKNNMVYTDLNIENGIYSIIIDQKYLDSAVYPIRISPTFGKTNVGGTGIDNGWGSSFVVCKQNTPSYMNITNVLAYAYWGNENNNFMKGIIYSDNNVTSRPLSLLKEGSAVGYISGQWQNSTTSYIEYDNITLWLGVYTQLGHYFSGDSGTTAQTIVYRQGTYPTVPTSYIPDAVTLLNLESSIYAKYIVLEEPPETIYYYDLNIESLPLGIDFFINGSTETTDYIASNITKAVLQFPNNVILNLVNYGFLSWEDNSTNPYREIVLTENMTAIAEYEILEIITLPIGTIPEQTFILGFGLAIVSLFGLVTGLVLINITEITFVYMLFNGLWTLNQQTNMFCWVIMLLSVVTLLLSFIKSGE